MLHASKLTISLAFKMCTHNNNHFCIRPIHLINNQVTMDSKCNMQVSLIDYKVAKIIEDLKRNYGITIYMA